jgi:hypothetical protein
MAALLYDARVWLVDGASVKTSKNIPNHHLGYGTHYHATHPLEMQDPLSMWRR